MIYDISKASKNRDELLQKIKTRLKELNKEKEFKHLVINLKEYVECTNFIARTTEEGTKAHKTLTSEACMYTHVLQLIETTE